jgi:hypothetical protein
VILNGSFAMPRILVRFPRFAKLFPSAALPPRRAQPRAIFSCISRRTV